MLQGPVQRRLVPPELAIGDGLQLDGIQGECHGVLDPVIAGQLRLKGILADLGIGVIGQIPDSGQRNGLAPVGHGHGTGQILLQVTPGGATGEAHLRHDRLAHAGQQIAAGLLHLAEKESIVLQIGIRAHQLCQILQSCRPALKSCSRSRQAAVNAHDPAQMRACLGIPGVGILPQCGIFRQPIGQIRDPLLGCNTLFQPRKRLCFAKNADKSGKTFHFLPQRV